MTNIIPTFVSRLTDALHIRFICHLEILAIFVRLSVYNAGSSVFRLFGWRRDTNGFIYVHITVLLGAVKHRTVLSTQYV